MLAANQNTPAEQAMLVARLDKCCTTLEDLLNIEDLDLISSYGNCCTTFQVSCDTLGLQYTWQPSIFHLHE